MNDTPELSQAERDRQNKAWWDSMSEDEKNAYLVAEQVADERNEMRQFDD
jgi:hypothetical protein